VYQLLESHRYDAEFYAVIPAKIAAGEIKYKEDITTGLEGVGSAIFRALTGAALGKALVRVADQ
jgi:NADPH-dependent curcumin reductase CurA